VTMDLTTRGKGKRYWRPGAIFCLCVNYHQFFVQGFDRSGKPFVSSDPRRYFVIECQNGMSLTQLEQAQSQNLSLVDDNLGPVSLIVYDDPGLPATVEWLRRLVHIFLWAVSVIAFLWCYVCHKSPYTRNIRFAGIGAAGLSVCCLAAWYFYVLWPAG
jgi:hypothetical protein